jgi:hypothetical protein
MKIFNTLLRNFNRRQKFFVALTLSILIIGLFLWLFIANSKSASNFDVESDVDTIARASIANDEYFVKYGGYDLKLDSVERSCLNCATLTYTYKINTTLLIKSIKGFKVIIQIQNNTLVDYRNVRLT